jgi:hypothetical protein
VRVFRSFSGSNDPNPSDKESAANTARQFFCILFFLCRITTTTQSINMAKVGGMKEVKPIDADATAIANHVKADVESKAGKSYGTYEPVSYATQVPQAPSFWLKFSYSHII